MSDPGSQRQYVPLLVLLVVALGAIAIGSGFASQFDAGSLSPVNESNSDASSTELVTNETNATTPNATTPNATTESSTTDADDDAGDSSNAGGNDGTDDSANSGSSNNAGSSNDAGSSNNGGDSNNAGNSNNGGDSDETDDSEGTDDDAEETTTAAESTVQSIQDSSNQCGQLTVSNPNEFAVTYTYTVQETNEGDDVPIGPGEDVTIDLDLGAAEGQYYVVTEAVRSDTGESVPVEDEATSAITESVQACAPSETTETSTSTPTETSSPVVTETTTSTSPSVQSIQDSSNQCGQLTVSNPNEFAVTYTYTVQETNEGDDVPIGPGEDVTIDLDLSGSEGEYYVVTEAVRSDTGESVPVEDEETSAITESVQACGSPSSTTTSTSTTSTTTASTTATSTTTTVSTTATSTTTSTPTETATPTETDTSTETTETVQTTESQSTESQTETATPTDSDATTTTETESASFATLFPDTRFGTALSCLLAIAGLAVRRRR